MGKFQNKYTEDELLGFLHQFKSSYGRVPSSTDIDREIGYPRASIYTKRFGSYKNALDLAGLERLQPKNNKYEDKYLLKCYKEVYDFHGRQPTLAEYDEYYSDHCNFPSKKTLYDRFGNFENINTVLKLKTQTSKYGGYKKEFLISEIKRFKEENGRLPTSNDLDKKGHNYPSRKTYQKYFGSINNALREAGFDVKDRPIITKEFLKDEFFRYIEEFDKIPFAHDIDSAKGYPGKYLYSDHFGSWNNAIMEFGLKPKVSHYTDEELKDSFLMFVNLHGRIPHIQEFNNSDYPSFWCYQNRFGSWNKAVEAYGFDANYSGTGFNHTFEDGELVKSSFEFDTSTYFRENNIEYQRDVLYRDYIDNYNGRKNCDYVVNFNGEDLFIEIAGFITESKNKSSIEKDYIKRFDHKLSLLNNSNLKFLVLYPKDFKENSIEELFSFLNT